MENMVNSDGYISKEKLIETVVSILPVADESQSELKKAGAQSLMVGPNHVFREISMGGGTVLAEGQAGKLTDIGVEDKYISSFVISIMFSVSDQFMRTKEGQSLAARYLQAAVNSAVKSSDILGLHGTTADTGLPVAEFANGNIVNNATQHVSTTGTPFDVDIRELLKAQRNPATIMLSPDSLAEVAYTTNNSGDLRYPLVSRNEKFEWMYAETFAAKTVGMKGFTKDTEIPSNVLAVTGDFTKVQRRVDFIDVRFNDTYAAGVALWDRRLKAYALDLGISFYAGKPEDIANNFGAFIKGD